MDLREALETLERFGVTADVLAARMNITPAMLLNGADRSECGGPRGWRACAWDLVKPQIRSLLPVFADYLVGRVWLSPEDTSDRRTAWESFPNSEPRVVGEVFGANGGWGWRTLHDGPAAETPEGALEQFRTRLALLRFGRNAQ